MILLWGRSEKRWEKKYIPAAAATIPAAPAATPVKKTAAAAACGNTVTVTRRYLNGQPDASCADHCGM